MNALNIIGRGIAALSLAASLAVFAPTASLAQGAYCCGGSKPACCATEMACRKSEACATCCAQGDCGSDCEKNCGGACSGGMDCCKK